MIRSYVCYQCRAQLSRRIASTKSPQWYPKATFISLRDSQHQSDPKPEPATEDKVHEGTLNGTEGGEKPLVRFHRSFEKDAERPQAGRYSKREQHKEGHQIRHLKLPYKDVDKTISDSSSLGPSQSASLTCAQAIDRSLRQRDVNQAWHLFLKNYTTRDSPAFTNPAFNDVPLLTGGKLFAQLLDRVTTQFCNGGDVQATPTAVLFRYEQLGIAKEETWRKAIVDLTDQVLWSIHGARGNRRDTESLVHELMSLWRLFFQCRGEENDPLESISPEWRSIPDVHSTEQPPRGASFGGRLQHYHPKSISSPPLQFSAVTVFNMFSEVNQEAFRVSDSLRTHSLPFVRLLTHLLAGSNVSSALTHTNISQAFKALPDQFRASVIEQTKSAPRRAMKIVGSHSNSGQSKADDGPELTEAQKASNLEEFFLKRITRAVESQAHVGRLEELWSEVLEDYQTKDSVAIPSRIYNAFLSGYMSLYQSGHAVTVWNHMVSHGVKPEMRTWTAMLEGCVKARDLTGLNAVWERLLKSGVEPDNHAWTTRVYGLMSLRQINLAFNALDEMGKKWLSAENVIKNPPQQGKSKGSKNLPKAKLVNTITKPSIEVINGAISALVQMPEQGLRFERRVTFMQKVLQWAGNFDVKPDTRTYNILIQLYLSANDYPTTLKLLRQMEREGVEGDLATHTMLIRAAFDNQRFNDLTESEQTDQILTLFSELEAGGLKLNAYIYSSTIDRLLKQYGNVAAVRAVIDHMTSRDLVLSPQIYTSLITYYFQQTPPDIAAVDSLTMQIFGARGGPTDKYLFDRIIEGYAQNGEVGKMMSVLARMGSHGKLPGWRALTAVVQALVEAGDWERARLIVKDVQMGEGVAKGGVTGGMRGQQTFFSTVRALGGGLTETLAGDYLQSPVKTDGAHQQEEILKDADMAGMVDPKVQEKYAQNQDLDDEFVNAEHASYLSDETGEHQQQWQPEQNGAVRGVPS